MNKNDVENLNYTCQRQILEILKHNISRDARKNLEGTYDTLCKDARNIAFKTGNTKKDKDKLEYYAKKFTSLNQNLDSILSKIEKAEQLNNNASFKEENIQPKDNNSETETKKEEVSTPEIVPVGKGETKTTNNKKEKTPKVKNNESNKKETLKRVVGISVATVVAISAAVAIFVNVKKDKNHNLGNNPSISTNNTNELKIDGAILNNPIELEKYASTILMSLNNSNLTISDVTKATKLANWDYLDIQKIMTSQEDLIKTMQLSSYIVNALGSDAIVYKDPYSDIYLSQTELQSILDSVADQKITVADYNGALVNGNYDIYKLMEINLKNVNEDNEKSAYFGKVANDIMSRVLLSSSLISNSPLATRYVLTAMYNDNAQTLIKKTTHFGASIYGDGISIDGDYGFTCVESLAEYLAYADKNGNINTDNAEIGIYSQLLIDSPTLSRK